MQLLPKLRRLRYSIASTGLTRTLMDVASHLTTYRAEDDRSFDPLYGTDTGGRVQTSELGIADARRQEQAAAVPSVREVFSRFPWLEETRYEPSLLGHYDWLFFSS